MTGYDGWSFMLHAKVGTISRARTSFDIAPRLQSDKLHITGDRKRWRHRVLVGHMLLLRQVVKPKGEIRPGSSSSHPARFGVSGHRDLLPPISEYRATSAVFARFRAAYPAPP